MTEQNQPTPPATSVPAPAPALRPAEPAAPKPDIRLVVVDVDGTLLDSNHALTKRVEKAIKAALAKGVQVVLATGKTRYATLQLIEQLGLKSPGIYLQGLAIYDGDGKLMHQQTLDPALARQVITFAEDRGFTVVAYSGERILARTYDKEVEEGLTIHHEIAPEVVGPLQNLLRDLPFNKVIACGTPRAVTALRWQLNLQVGGAGRLMQAGIPEMLEILPPGGSKGSALKLLLKDLKIDPANVMAIGDAENDIEMIQLAGIGVAMGQSAESVKAAADFVTGSSDEDGVAQALEKYVLDEPQIAEVEKSALDAPVAVINPVEPKVESKEDKP